MKNLKKLFAVIVVIAILATFAIPAFAAVPSDVEGTEYETAVKRLVALGIITGRPDGSYAPDETITRAEFAAVVVRAYGYDSAAAAAKGQTRFSDVSADYWASGYINLANSLGIINGRPDGTFGPNDPVRYEEAMTMIVRALGYEPKARALGGYPSGYLAIGSQEDIDRGAEGAAGMFAPRGLVAIMVDNALEVDMMEQTNFGTETRYEVVPGKTLISDYLKLKDYEVLITDTGAKMEVQYQKAYTKPDKANGSKEKLSVFEGISFKGLEGSYAKIWVKDNVVYSLKLDSQTYYGYITAVDGETDARQNTRAGNLQPTDATGSTGTNTDDEYEITVAGMDLDITVNTDVEFGSITEKTNALLNNRYFAKALVKDGKVEKLTYFDLQEGGIITKINEERIEYIKGDDDSNTLRGMDDAKKLIVIIDGKVAEYSDLETDMVFDFAEYAADEFIIVASSAKVEGELTGSGYHTRIYVDGAPKFLDDIRTSGANAKAYFSIDGGKSYEVFDADSDLSDLIGTDIVAYLNGAGNVRYIKGATEASTASFYGLVLDHGSSRGVNWVKVVREIDGKAEKIIYDLAGTLKSGSDPFSAVDNNDIFKFSVNADGLINSLDEMTVVDDDAESFNKTSNTIVYNTSSRIYVNNGTVILDEYETGKYRVVKWADIEDKTFAGTLSFMAVSEGGFAKLIVFDGGSLGAITGQDEFVAYVSGYTYIGKDEYRLNLVNGDGQFTVITDDVIGGDTRFVIYTENGTGTIAADAYLRWTPSGASFTSLGSPLGTSVIDTVYEINKDYMTVSGDTSTMLLFADNVLVYEVYGNSYQYAKESSVSSIDAGDSVAAYVVEDVVKAIFFVQN